jgi:myosin heavy subunit
MEEGLTTNLRIELDKTNHVFQKWTSDYGNWLDKHEQDYERVMEEVDATLQALRTTDQHLEESRALNDAIKQQQKKEIVQAHQQVEGYQRQLASLQQQLLHYQDEEHQNQERLEKLRQEHELLRQKVEHNLQDLTHGISHYAKMGLEFQKADGDSMKFIFTQIDRANPQRPFYFVMFVDENNTYRLVETSPELPTSQVAGLLQTLNETNDISVFVYRIRCLFVRSL